MTPRRLIEPARLAGAPLLRTQTDERLIDLTRAGNDRAFEAIVHRYRRPLLRYCSRLLPTERAEDAVQQAFVSAYSAMCSNDAELKLRPWLYRIAHNASLNLLRQNGWDHDEIDETLRVSEDGPEAAAERNERLESVLRAVEELPARQRDAVVLRALEGRSYEEIATALDISGGAVRQLLNRARTTLRSAATAVTPPELLVRLGAGPSEGGIAPRIAEACAGTGGAAALAKLGAAVVVAGAVAGSAVVDGPVEVPGADLGRADDSGAGIARDAANGGSNRAARVAAERSRPAARRSGRSRGDDDAGAVVLDSSGPDGGGSDGDADDRIVLGGGDNSGPGSDSSGSGSSGSGGGDSSGPGSGGTLDADGDSSGPGSGTLVDRSGPGDGSGSDSSGSGSSGSGSDNSGPGSG
jgi:RNA polymerase sigma factor (sigma-70 family)